MKAEDIDKVSAANAKAPRISLDYMASLMEKVWYANPIDVFSAPTDLTPEQAKRLVTTTICYVLMKNGYIVIGHSTPASPENYNSELGRQLAFEQCQKQLWPILGYELCTKLATYGPPKPE